MKNTFLAVAISLLASSAAQAAIVCDLQTYLGPAQVQIDGSTVKVKGAELKGTKTFKNIAQVYDGHATVLITAPGLAISYRSIYGCVRDAKITTNFRENSDIGYIDTADVKLCTDTSSSQNFCQ